MYLQMIASVIGIFILAPVVTADFMALEIESHANITTASGPKAVFRIYARFSSGADRLLSWAGTTNSLTTIKSGPCTTWGPFYQAPFGGNRAPDQRTIDKDPDTQWDTFATIGVSIANQGVPYDQTLTSPGFPPFINGVQFTTSSASVLAPNNSPQNRADFAGDGDPQTRVLMMQLTLNPEDYPYGQIGKVSWMNSAGQIFEFEQPHAWVGIAAHGRCCIPNGSCVVTYHSSCAQFFNGFFMNCDPCGSCDQTCTPDIAPHPGDGIVNVNDLLEVINSWGPCSPWDTVPADCSPVFGDNVVNVNDLLAVINGWGPCP